jgi:hypothetical protein
MKIYELKTHIYEPDGLRLRSLCGRTAARPVKWIKPAKWIKNPDMPVGAVGEYTRVADLEAPIPNEEPTCKMCLAVAQYRDYMRAKYGK